MYELNHEAPERFQISPFELGAHGRRKPVRVKSSSTRLREARDAQAATGERVRIWRKVTNEEDFSRQMRGWHKAHGSKSAERTNYRQFTLTVFDTKQQPLRNLESHSEEEWAELLEFREPALFSKLGPIAVGGVMRFGGNKAPFVALRFASPVMEAQRIVVRDTVGPELIISDSHQKLHQSHVSLGKVTGGPESERPRIASQLCEDLAGLVPKYVEFGPLEISVTRNS